MSLHNSALFAMEADPGAGFKKLNFLISSGNFPPETFGNLLLLYCAPAHQFYDLAADVMAENPAYCQELLSKVGGTLFVSVGWGWGGESCAVQAPTAACSPCTLLLSQPTQELRGVEAPALTAVCLPHVPPLLVLPPPTGAARVPGGCRAAWQPAGRGLAAVGRPGRAPHGGAARVDQAHPGRAAVAGQWGGTGRHPAVRRRAGCIHPRWGVGGQEVVRVVGCA